MGCSRPPAQTITLVAVALRNAVVFDEDELFVDRTHMELSSTRRRRLLLLIQQHAVLLLEREKAALR